MPEEDAPEGETATIGPKSAQRLDAPGADNLSAGARLGPYEVLGLLGSGGMGAVYKARDTRLDRTVAIKVLKPGAELEAGQERLHREAKAVSRLAHAHICHLYDVAVDAGRQFLIMEFLEGVSLQDRLRRGPLARAEFFQYAIEITNALDHAHRHGVIHRDVKPGNVMLAKAGGEKPQAKLLDFGLAVLHRRPEVEGDASVEGHLTRPGAVVGTPQYMAPEQLSGREADVRTDVFAVGALFFEMATGRKAFDGKTWPEMAAAIISGPRPSLGAAGDPALDRLIQKCLAKDPDDRWQTARDLRSELEWLSVRGAETVPLRRRRSAIWIAAGALVAVVAVSAAIVLRAPVSGGPPVVRLAIPLPEAELPDDPGRLNGPPAISPDGRAVVMPLGVGPTQALWMRRLDSDKFERLAGTEGGAFPFWSADGRQIGFFARGRLRKMDLREGSPQALCPVEDPGGGPRGGAWNAAGTILYGMNYVGLLQVSARGGEPVKVAGLDERIGENSLRFPEFLPDGRHFIYFSRTRREEDAAVYLDTLDPAGKAPRKRLVAADGAAHLGRDPASGRYYLLYPKQGRLWAQAFDLAGGDVTGDALAISEDVGQFTVSGTGILVFRRTNSEQNRINWVERSGRDQGAVGNAGDYWALELSPDNRHLAVLNHRSVTGRYWIELIDLARNLQSPFSDPAQQSYSPVWSRDSKRVFFYSEREQKGQLFVKAVDDAGPEQPLGPATAVYRPTELTPDGRAMLATLWSGNDRTLMISTLGSNDWRPLLRASSYQQGGQFSPDGRWVAYESNESGAAEVYVTDFPDGRRKHRISTAGGTEPRWRGDGKELFYLAPDGTLMAAAIAMTNPPAVRLSALFKKVLQSYDGTRYAVQADGQRFLFVNATVDERSRALSVVSNWPQLLHSEH